MKETLYSARIDTKGKYPVELLKIMEHKSFSPFPQVSGYRVQSRYWEGGRLIVQSADYAKESDANAAFDSAVEKAKR